MDVGRCPTIVNRLSFTGELGYELYVPAEYHLALYEALLQAGQDLGLRHFGGRALNSLRLEKSFGAWLREFTPDHTPFEAGLGRFVNLKKGDFTGRRAAEELAATEPKQTLVTLVVEAGDADAQGDEPVFHDGEVVGFITSGGYGHTVGQSIALAYLKTDTIAADRPFEVEILGERRPARLVTTPLYDPTGARMRG